MGKVGQQLPLGDTPVGVASIASPQQEKSARHAQYTDNDQEPPSRCRGPPTHQGRFTQGMQRGRGAPGFAGGVFSAVMDSPTHAFHAWVAARLAA